MHSRCERTASVSNRLSAAGCHYRTRDHLYNQCANLRTTARMFERRELYRRHARDSGTNRRADARS